MSKEECNHCIKRKTIYCPNSNECYSLDNLPYFQTKLDVLKENKKLKKQLDYLRSGEYYNQLRFENEMLQQVVDTNGVPSEIYDYIDCTHRNTELLEENQELKKQLEEKENIACNWKDSCLENAGKIEKLENQQKEFISYLENEKDRLARECSNIYEDTLGKTRLVNEDIFNEVDTILSKYKKIIGGKDE